MCLLLSVFKRGIRIKKEPAVMTQRDDQDDRTNALGLLGFAHSYWVAAVTLQNTPRSDPHRNAPVDYLYYHAIELYLKSFLRLKDVSLSQLRRISHRIDRLYDAAVECGLTDKEGSRELAALINLHYLPARYLSTGIYTVPTHPALWDMCKTLHNEITPQVDGAWGLTRPRPIPIIAE